MKSIDLKGNLRSELGKTTSKNLRKQEQVPCVLYGKGENVHFHVHESAFKQLVYSPNAYLVNFDLDGSKYHAVMRDIQFHPVTDKILHADFYQIDEKSEVWMKIPVRLEGNSVGVLQGGRLVHKLRKVRVKALPNDLPDEIVVDISKLGLGKSVKIGDIDAHGVKFLEPDNAVVVIVKTARGAQTAEAEEEAEGEEGAEGTEGSAPAEESAE